MADKAEAAEVAPGLLGLVDKHRAQAGADASRGRLAAQEEAAAEDSVRFSHLAAASSLSPGSRGVGGQARGQARGPAGRGEWRNTDGTTTTSWQPRDGRGGGKRGTWSVVWEASKASDSDPPGGPDSPAVSGTEATASVTGRRHRKEPIRRVPAAEAADLRVTVVGGGGGKTRGEWSTPLPRRDGPSVAAVLPQHASPLHGGFAAPGTRTGHPDRWPSPGPPTPMLRGTGGGMFVPLDSGGPSNSSPSPPRRSVRSRSSALSPRAGAGRREPRRGAASASPLRSVAPGTAPSEGWNGHGARRRTEVGGQADWLGGGGRNNHNGIRRVDDELLRDSLLASADLVYLL